ncbi:gephyrin-like molybdotransferase Glp [Teredinibacter turnerae]|uniref:molybdopterin molybdotransferase MoeA n=1 Tax=Teredinibacter turnerae TaxID=2426 RepID=UPI00048BCFBB|nr:gephyrin-like molybdotransferase Glp [Teredinibacter turnerae]
MDKSLDSARNFKIQWFAVNQLLKVLPMNSCDQPGLLPLEAALQRMIAVVNCAQNCEYVPLLNARGRVLAEDIIASRPIPDFDNSAMDGYAFASNSVGRTDTFRVAGIALAGQPYLGALSENECIRIMTGAKMPSGCDCVAMQENTLRDGDALTLLKVPANGENVRLAGHDLPQGSRILLRGRRLGPVDIGMLASLGELQVPVYTKPRVGVFSTGDELTPLGQPLEPGRIYDSNRYLLLSALAEYPIEVIDFGSIPDDRQKLEQVFLEAASQCHAVISSGGVSVGDADYTRELLVTLGQVDFYKLAIKPGKPFAFGTLHTAGDSTPCYFFGLPGNPVSAAVTFEQLALPALEKLTGANPQAKLVLKLRACSSFKKRPGRTDFQRGRILANHNGIIGVESINSQSSGALSTMVVANAYVRLEQERGNVEEGEYVDVLPFDTSLPLL